jgi:hypothetical protein
MLRHGGNRIETKTFKIKEQDLGFWRSSWSPDGAGWLAGWWIVNSMRACLTNKKVV